MDKIKVLNDSRMARLVFDTIESYLRQHKERHLTRLLSETKTGPLDPQTYAKHLGGISALEELEIALKRDILKGEKTEMELLNEHFGNG